MYSQNEHNLCEREVWKQWGSSGLVQADLQCSGLCCKTRGLPGSLVCSCPMRPQLIPPTSRDCRYYRGPRAWRADVCSLSSPLIWRAFMTNYMLRIWAGEARTWSCLAVEIISGEESRYATSHFGGVDHLCNCLCSARWGL